MIRRALGGLLLTFLSSSAQAAEFHPAPTATRYPGEPAAAAKRFVADAAPALGLAGVDLVADRVVPSAGRRNVRLAQRHHGVPVLGGVVAVRLGRQGEVTLAVVDVARGITVDPTPTVTQLQAITAAEQHLGVTIAMGPSPTLAVWPDASVGGRLVWVVDVPDAHGGTRTLIDAHRGDLVVHQGLGRDVLGRVYSISKVVTPAPVDVELTGIDLADPQMLTGWTGGLTVTNYVSGTQGSDLVVEQELLPSAGTDFLYDPPADGSDATDAFAQVGVFHHLTRMRDYFTTTHGLDMTTAAWGLVAVANMQEGGAPLNNAFFSPMGVGAPWTQPNMIGIGQGTTFDFADDSDVFLHEFGHYISHNAVGYSQGQIGVDEYGLSPFAGGIDEGIADYFACTENDDPILGEASLALLGSARDLTDTSKRCPDDILGEVHADGEIVGSFGWTLRETFGKTIADRLVWGSVALLTPQASLGDFATGILATAEDLVAEGELEAADIATIEGLAADRGLDQCGRVLEVSDAAPQTAQLVGLDLVAQAFGGADCGAVKAFGVTLQSFFHYAHTPAAGTTSLRFDATFAETGGGELDWSLYVRKDQHVTFTSGGFFPIVGQYDYATEGLTADDGEIVIDASSDPPFDPDATYYMVLVHANCPNALVTFTAGEGTPSTGEGGGGGAPPTGGSGNAGVAPNGLEPQDDDGDDGCGCRAAGADPTNPIPWVIGTLAFGAIAALRSRRRRPFAG